MTSLLLKFRCDLAALEALTEDGELGLGVLTFEPLQIRADLAVSASALLITVAVSVPVLAPHDLLQFNSEVGVLDIADAIWHARTADSILRHPGGAFKRLPLGPRREVLKYARADGSVWFGLIINDLVLLPEHRGRGPGPVRRAYQNGDFIVRRLRAENLQLASKLSELEHAFNQVLTTIGGQPEPLPCSAPAEGEAVKAQGGAQRPDLRGLADIADAVRTIVKRGDPTELRSLQLVLAELQANTVSELTEAENCVICLEVLASEFFLPCGHRCCCAACTGRLKGTPRLCPVCRAPIAKVTKTPPAEPAAPSPRAQEKKTV